MSFTTEPPQAGTNTIEDTSTLCHVCGRGFESEQERNVHRATHPGRTDEELAAAIPPEPEPEPISAPEPEPISEPLPLLTPRVAGPLDLSGYDLDAD